MRALVSVLVSALVVGLGAADAVASPSGATLLRQGAAQFLDGELDGLAVDALGQLVPAPVVREEWATPSQHAWSLCFDRRGRLIVGTGSEGKLYRQHGDGFEEWATTLAMEILALLPWEDGVLAGSSPDGVIYRIDAEGEVSVALDLPLQSVWALVEGSEEGSWLAGAGPGARVFRGGRGHEAGEELYRLGATNVTALVRDDRGLWIGTQGPGQVWRVEGADGDAVRLRYEAPQGEIAALVGDGHGGVFVLSVDAAEQEGAGGSRISHLFADAGSEVVFEGKETLVEMGPAPGGQGLVVGESSTGRIALVDPSGSLSILDELPASDPLAIIERAGEVWVATSNAGGVFRLAPTEHGGGSWTSAVLPTPRAVQWGRLWVEGFGKTVRFAARSGQRAEPDATWSDWSDEHEAGARVDAPVGDYLQVRLHVEDAAVVAVRLAYAERNLPPRVRSIKVEPDGGDLYASGSNGNRKTASQQFEDGLAVEYSIEPTVARAEPEDVAWARGLRTLVWAAEDENGDRLRYRLEIRRWPDGEWVEIERDLENRVYAWDTRAFEDGLYRVRVTASDAVDHPPGQGREGSLVGPALRVDNTPPQLRDLRFDGRVLSCVAADAGTRIAEVDLHTGDGVWKAVAAVDGVLDAPVESMRASFDEDAAVEVVVIRVVDGAGNVLVREVRSSRR